MLRAILNRSWRQHPTRRQLYGYLPSITKTIQVRQARHAGHCWRSRDELISDVLLWTPTHGRAKAGWPARTYIQELCEDTGCCLEDLSETMNDREKWQERIRDIRASSTTWWWWLLFNSNNSSQRYSSLCKQLNSFEHCHEILKSQFSLNNFFCTQLNGFKFRKWVYSLIWPLDGSLTGTTTRGKRAPRYDVNYGLQHIKQSFRPLHQMIFSLMF